MKFLLDENLCGVKKYLHQENFPFNVENVCELRQTGHKLKSDYSVVRYAHENGYVLVTADFGVLESCLENNFDVCYINFADISKDKKGRGGHFKKNKFNSQVKARIEKWMLNRQQIMN